MHTAGIRQLRVADVPETLKALMSFKLVNLFLLLSGIFHQSKPTQNWELGKDLKSSHKELKIFTLFQNNVAFWQLA